MAVSTKAVENQPTFGPFGPPGIPGPNAPTEYDFKGRDDAAYPLKEAGLRDFFPKSETEMAKLVSWCQSAFQAADSARKPQEVRWDRYYKLYRSYIKRRVGDWQSRVFFPVSFWIVETILPRLVAALPRMVCIPIGPDDVQPARDMEVMLEWAANNSDLYPELVKAVKSSLKYGTGLLKTFQKEDIRTSRRLVPLPAEPQTQTTSIPSMDPETGLPLLDVNNNPITETREDVVGYQSPGQTWEPFQYVAYDGPAAEFVDLYDVWVAPEATDFQGARYVIHRVYREMSYILQRVSEGIYRWPEGMSPSDLAPTKDEPLFKRLSSIELSAGGSQGQADPTRKQVEILEFWTADGRVITMANRKTILRCHENPFDHGQKPFIRLVDHLQEGEFYGVGEIESIEGLQDITNALVNRRLDNVKLTLDRMIAIKEEAIVDMRDLVPRPGGIVRVSSDQPINEVFHPLEIPDVTQAAFAEAQQIENFIERTTGVTGYQLGVDSPSLNDTATGVNILTESGATRFGLKTRLMELTGFKQIAQQFGSLIQQFQTEQRYIRLLGPSGDWAFHQIDPASLAGNLDYDIEVESAAVTEQNRRRDALSLFQVLGPALQGSPGMLQLVMNVLRAFNIKDMANYIQPAQPQLMPGQPGPPTTGQPGSAPPAPGQAGQGGPAPGPPQPPGPSQPQPGQSFLGRPFMPIQPQERLNAP